MKIRLLVLLAFISIKCYSQSISDYTIYPNPISNPFTIKFTVNTQDSISLIVYDVFGKPRFNILTNEFLNIGTYKIQYTYKDSLPIGVYYSMLKNSDIKLAKTLVNKNSISSSKLSDFIKITYFDSIKIYDTTKIIICDTTKILIIDTLDCDKTIANLKNIKTFPIHESVVFHDNLTLDFSDADYLIIYEMSGKLTKQFRVDSYTIPLQDLKTGIYIGLFYQNRNITHTIKMIKE